MENTFAAAQKAIIELKKDEAIQVAQQGIAEGVDPLQLLNKGFIPGIAKVGDLFGEGKFFLPELIKAAEIMRFATEVINEALTTVADRSQHKIVIGTVEGDVHDIGKSIVVSLFRAHGFDVYDIGRDAPSSKFIEKAEEVGAQVIGSSALLTTTMQGQRKLEEELRTLGFRNKYKTIVGGAPVTQRWANRIGADAYAEDAIDGVNKVRQLLVLAEK